MCLSGLLFGRALTCRVLPFTPFFIAYMLVFARATFFCATPGGIKSDADFCSSGSVRD